MYILIPTKKDSGRSDAISTPQKPKQLEHGDLGGTSLEKRQEDPLKYQHRYLKMTKPSYDHSQTGFLWSWNFMISRRWKQTCNSGATGDIPFMDKMLHDFRMFCSNKDGRLENFWLEFSNSAEPVLA